MKSVTIHQAEFLPWIGFFYKMSKAEIFIIFDLAQYNKQDFQNRNRFRCNEEVKWLNIPVKAHPHTAALNEIMISNNIHWQKKIYNRITNYYRKSPYYIPVLNLLRPIWKNSWTRLVDINVYMIKEIAHYLNIRPVFYLSSNLISNISEFNKLSNSEKNLALCKMVSAENYLSGVYGKKYLDLNCFKSAGITVNTISFCQQQSINYSIIDTLFWNHPEDVREKIDNFGFVENQPLGLE